MWQREMTAELRSAPSRARKPILERYAEMTGKSQSTLYRIARENGFDSGRSQRRDKGACGLTEEQISFVAALIHTSAREVKGTIMDVGTALHTAEKNGIIDPGTVSVSRMQGLLRERHIHRAALDTPDPKIQMRSLHPNHVHVFDASICIQYYLRDGKGLRIMDERKFYKNKPQNFTKVRHKLIRYVLVDHFSHALFVKYYYTGGETQANLYDFLLSAWAGGKHAKFPFRGVPFFVLMDAGAANVSRAVLAFLERLDIELPAALPHNAPRQGSAEVAQNLVEGKFESMLRFQPAHTVEDLNDWALDWCVWFNGTRKHSRHKMTRTDCWMTIRHEQLRELPDREILHQLFAEPEVERTVDRHYFISFKGKPYRLKHIPGLIPNRSTVDVVLRPYHWPEIGVIFSDKEYLVTPTETVAGEFRADAAVIGAEYKAVPETPTQRAKKRLENLAYGEERGRHAVPFEGMQMFGGHADQVDREYLPRSGETLDVGRGARLADPEVAIITLLKQLRRELGEVPPEINRSIRGVYGTTIALAEKERLVALARDGMLTEKEIAAGSRSRGANEERATG